MFRNHPPGRATICLFLYSAFALQHKIQGSMADLISTSPLVASAGCLQIIKLKRLHLLRSFFIDRIDVIKNKTFATTCFPRSNRIQEK